MDWSAHQKELTEVAGHLGWEQVTAIADRVADFLAARGGTMTAEALAALPLEALLSWGHGLRLHLAAQGTTVATLQANVAELERERDIARGLAATNQEHLTECVAERDSFRAEVRRAHAVLDQWRIAPGPLEARLREARFGPADDGGEDGEVVPIDSETVRNLMAQALPAMESKALMLEQRARAAEASQQALLAAGAEFQERLLAVEADRDGWKFVAIRALVLNVLVRAQWERYVLAAAGHHLDGCPGAGKCHGSLTWCRQCGDVALLCDMNGRCDLHRDRWLEHILERAPVAKFAREEGYAAGRGDAEAERLKEVEDLRARLRRARTDAWAEAVDVINGEPLASTEAHAVLAPALARLKPSGQAAEDEALVLALLPPQSSPASEPELRIAKAALSRLAAKAQGYEVAVADNAAWLRIVTDRLADDWPASWRVLFDFAAQPHPGAALLAERSEREQAVQPFLALARDRLQRVSYEPIPLEDCRRLLAAFNASPVEEQNG